MNFAAKLKDLGVADTYSIRRKYNEPHRYFHNWIHITDILNQLDNYASKYVMNEDEYNQLFLATIFHDAIYNPKKSDNEESSVEFFKSLYTGKYLNDVCQIILDTKTHQPTSTVSNTFCRMDLNILTKSLDELIVYESQIFKEFQFVDWAVYKTKRIEILRELSKNPLIGPNKVGDLISYINTKKPNIGIYAGSFNPFHIGHRNVLQKAEQIFDKVIIAKGTNYVKQIRDIGWEPYEFPEAISFRQCIQYTGLLTTYMDNLGYDVTLIRGLRNATDLQYESTQYRFLQDLKPNIKVVSVFCDKEYEHISSSAIKSLVEYGEDKKYLLK